MRGTQSHSISKRKFVGHDKYIIRTRRDASAAGTGGGLVTIIDGVGTSTVSDNVAETAALRLEDFPGDRTSVVAERDICTRTRCSIHTGPSWEHECRYALGYTVSREDQFGNLVSVSGTEIYLYTNSPSSNDIVFQYGSRRGWDYLNSPDGST